jgi:hypothetical protein
LPVRQDAVLAAVASNKRNLIVKKVKKTKA